MGGRSSLGRIFFWYFHFTQKKWKKNETGKVFFGGRGGGGGRVGLLQQGCLPDLLHEGGDFGVAPWVDGPALLLAGLAANVGGDVVEDGGDGDVDDVGPAEGAGDGELVLLKRFQSLRRFRNPVCQLSSCSAPA